MDDKGSQGEDADDEGWHHILDLFFFSDPPDDEGGHDVVERVELRLAAQHQRVLDVRESLQNLEKTNEMRNEKTYSLSIFRVLS